MSYLPPKVPDAVDHIDSVDECFEPRVVTDLDEMDADLRPVKSRTENTEVLCVFNNDLFKSIELPLGCPGGNDDNVQAWVSFTLGDSQWAEKLPQIHSGDVEAVDILLCHPSEQPPNIVS